MPERKNEIEIVIKADDKASKKIGGVGGALKNLGKVAGAAALGVGVAAVGIGAALTKLAIDAAPLEGIARAFEGIAESAGVGAEDMLKALQKGSKGMISQRDLMMSFNQAAQLVSTDFAKTLPDAMEMLGKVSSATGQDMGFMMESLVRGVGRMSPMILDNLGIQVSLTEATETYAKELGISVDEMSKAQQQTALMNQVMEKLAVNTASMPDITENASTKLAQMGAKFDDLKDTIGTAVLPVLMPLLDALMDAADNILPGLIQGFQDWMEALQPVVEALAEIAGPFLEKLMAGDWEGALGELGKIFEEFDIGAAVGGWAGQIWDAILHGGGVGIGGAAQGLFGQAVFRMTQFANELEKAVDDPAVAARLEQAGADFAESIGDAIGDLFSDEERAKNIWLSLISAMIKASFRIGTSLKTAATSYAIGIIKFVAEFIGGAEAGQLVADGLNDNLKIAGLLVLPFMPYLALPIAIGFVQGIAEGITKNAELAANAVKQMFENAGNTLRSQDWGGIGAGIARSIAAGIVGAAQAISDAIWNAIKDGVGFLFGPLTGGIDTSGVTGLGGGGITSSPTVAGAPSYNLNIYTNAPIENVIEDFRLMESMV